MIRRSIRLISFVVCLVAGWTAQAAAQPLGVFRWQMQPYCNVLTLTVVAHGPSFLLTGSDDMCGAGVVGATTGTAVQNPAGSIALGLSVITPDGAAAHINATVTLPSVSGTWQDGDGRSGAFVFNPPPASGAPPRPVPSRPVAITSAQLAASIFAGSGTATTIARSDHVHDDRYFTQTQVAAIVEAAGAVGVQGVGLSVPALSPQYMFPPEPFTTTKAGQLYVTRPISLISYTCVNSVAVRYVYLALDDVPIGSSFVILPAGTTGWTGMLSGVTTGSVPAGAHTIRVALQCSPGAFTNSSFYGTGKASLIVLP